MSFNYLYYPSISLPNNAWLRKVLLYSENIASIVPHDIDKSVNDNIKLLESEDEYNSLSPEDFLSSSEYKEAAENFKNEVMAYFNSEYFINLISNKKNQNKSLLYNSKFTYEIQNLFQQMNILWEDKENNGWWETPKIVGDTYLGILAKHMGSNYNYVPTTDRVQHQRIAFNNTSLPTDKVGEIRLIESLPSPSNDVPISELLKFKKERRQELLKFRTVLRENIEKLRLSTNEEELLENIQIFKEQIEIEVIDLEKMLKDNRINFIFESVRTLVELDRELISKIATGTSLSAVTGTSLLSGATIGLATDIAFNISNIVKDYHIQKNSLIRESPFSYAFYTNQFIRKTSGKRSNTKLFI